MHMELREAVHNCGEASQQHSLQYWQTGSLGLQDDCKMGLSMIGCGVCGAMRSQVQPAVGTASA